MRVYTDEARRVVRAGREIDGELHHQQRKQPVRGAVAALGDQDAGKKDALQGTDDRGELDPIEREARHAQEGTGHIRAGPARPHP